MECESYLDSKCETTESIVRVQEVDDNSESPTKTAPLGDGKTTTASSAMETSIVTNSSVKSGFSQSTARKLKRKHMRAFKKRVASAYLLDNILV